MVAIDRYGVTTYILKIIHSMELKKRMTDQKQKNVKVAECIFV